MLDELKQQSSQNLIKSEEINNSNEKKETAQSKIQNCKFCSAQFETINDYLAHIERIHHNNASNNYMCSVCGKQYRTRNELTQHNNSKCGTIKQFKCKVCEQELMSAGSLYNHMLRHNGVRSFMCRFCAKFFFTAGQLKVHERIHTRDKAYICDVCNKGFCHRQSLITHSTLHTGIKPYQCENCGNSFSCVGNLLKHRKSHADTCGATALTSHRVKHPSTKIKVRINTPLNSKLKMREKSMKIQEEMENLKSELYKDDKEIQFKIHHAIQEVKIEEKDVEVKIESDNNVKNSPNLSDDENADNTNESSDEEECNEVINKNKSVKKKKDYTFEELTEFIKQTNFEKEGYADCKYCNKRYINMHWLYKHVKNHEKNIPPGADQKYGVPLHKCSCCKLAFYTKEESLLHQQITHADILTCHECDKIFANRDSLNAHQKVSHKGFFRKEYIYICEKCGKQFKQKSYLKAHEERSCEGGPFYECTICKKQFTTIYTRNNHMRIHDSEKKLLCKFCAKSFHWKGQLKIHERSHTGEKPFACLYCPKAFAYRESLLTHSSIHTGIKPHLCDGCGARFSCIGNLIKHRSSHADECGAWAYKTKQENS